MADKKLNIKVRTQGAEQSKRKLKGVEGGLKSLGKQAMVAGAAFFGARAIVGGLKTVIDLAGKQELAEKKLEAALGRTSKALLKQASALQKVSMFGDEAIIEAQALIAAFVDDEEAIKKATAATLDLAAAKGMDLNAAADLVSKTLGSSTNAMSRYGIEVEGAVGSTERLDSLVGNIADKFGGQAAAQADTMTGSIEQMKNAMGDIGEIIGGKLSPLISSLAKGITSLTTSTVSEETETRILFNTLKDVTASEETRKRALDSINSIYGKYLPNLLTEHSSLGDIEAAQNRVTSAILKRLALSINEKKIRNLMSDMMELRGEEPGLIDKSEQAAKKYQDVIISGQKHADVLAQTQDQNYQNYTSYATLSANAESELNKNREQQIATQAEINKLNEEAVSLADSFNQTIIGSEDKKEQIEAQKAMSDELLNSQDIVETGWLPALREWNFELEKINSITNSFSEETSPVMIDALGGIWAQISQGAPFLKSISDGFVNVDTASADATGNMMGSLSALNEATAGSGKKSKLWAKTQKALLVGESIMHTYSAAIKMLDPKYGGAPPLNYIQSAAVVTAGLANLINIKSQKFAKGGEFVTNKPEMIMVGEAGREHVKITPIDRPEDRALKGGDIVLNISAPLVDETVVNSIIPAIEKAQRLNLA